MSLELFEKRRLLNIALIYEMLLIESFLDASASYVPTDDESNAPAATPQFEFGIS